MKEYEDLYQQILREHESVFAAQDQTQLEAALAEIAAAGRIFVIGAGREGTAARSFAMRLMHLGKDLLIAINGSGCIGHIDYLLDQAGKTGARRLVITGAPAERTPSEAEVSLFVPAMVYKGTDPRTIPSKQPMGNLFEQHLFLLFDLMVMLLVDRLHETPQTMEARHRNIE